MKITMSEPNANWTDYDAEVYYTYDCIILLKFIQRWIELIRVIARIELICKIVFFKRFNWVRIISMVEVLVNTDQISTPMIEICEKH